MFDLHVQFHQQGNIKGLNSAVDKAVRFAQKDAVRKLKSSTAKYVAAQYWLSQAIVRKHTTELPTGIKVSSKRLSLDKYKLSPKSPKSRVHLKAAVRRDGGLKPLVKRAFIRSISGSPKPFQRTGRKRLPIKLLVGPAIPQLVDNPGVIEHIQEEAAQTFSNRFDHYISRFGGAR